jgi:hypothetical protein
MSEFILPTPGSLLVYDCRTSNREPPVLPTSFQPLRVLQWNVERNYKADRIIEIIRELDPDIVCLQVCNIYK